MSEADEIVVDTDEEPDLSEYYMKAEQARGMGLTKIVSVGLEVPPDLEHMIVPGEQKASVVVCFIHPRANWPVVMPKLEETHAPMIVKWVLPIGELPMLLAAPVSIN